MNPQLVFAGLSGAALLLVGLMPLFKRSVMWNPAWAAHTHRFDVPETFKMAT